MRQVQALAIVVMLGIAGAVPGPARADDADAPADAPARSLAEALEDLRAGAEALLRGWIDEVEPHLRDLEPKGQALAEDMSRALRELFEPLGGIGAYHPPEILPNGDIILRRRQPEPESETDPETDPGGDVPHEDQPPESDSDPDSTDPFEL